MQKFLRNIFLLVGTMTFLMGRAYANDHMFPSLPQAAQAIHFDGKGFIIHGKRTFIVSGSLHYDRVPKAQWRDRLLRMKRAGFNCVQTYVFWNVQEPEPDTFNFKGRANLNAFLKLAHSMGMYATVRVGPYSCAEWDSGGYPVWLRSVKGLLVRQPNKPFEDALKPYFRKLLPIVAENQINHGGSVIMVQLENEHPLGWGTDMPNQYFHFLLDEARKYGIEVPTFFSGEHHGSDPAGNTPWSSSKRVNPWYTTEFWPGWYTLYGDLSPSDYRFFTRGTWKIIAYGGNGYNYYMLVGSSNFDYYNNDEDAASYDYAGAIGQAGDLRPIYYRFKKAAMFARSMESVLEDSDNSTAEYSNAASNPQIAVTARTAPAGSIVFLDNNTKTVQLTSLSTGTQQFNGLKVLSGEIRPVVLNYKLLPGVTMKACTPRLLSITQQGRITTMVVYDPTGEKGTVQFSVAGAHDFMGAPAAWNHQRDAVTLDLTANAHPQDYSFAAGGHVVRVLSMNEKMADRTWSVEAGGVHYVICGPHYVGDASVKGGTLHVVSETPAGDASAGGIVYGPTLKPALLSTSHPTAMPAAPALHLTGIRSGTTEAAPVYPIKGWTISLNPKQMGADGYNGAYAWYRSTIYVPTGGVYTLHFSDVGDWLSVFINGKHQVTGQLLRRDDTPVKQALVVHLHNGYSTIAVFTVQFGRPKLYAYLGPLSPEDRKGLGGPVTIAKGVPPEGQNVVGWEWQPAPVGGSNWQQATALQASGNWQPAAIGQDLFNKQPGWVWGRTSLPNMPGVHHTVTFQSVDDNGTVYLNGVKLARHEGWDTPFKVSLDKAWNPNGPNVLAVLIQNTANTGGLDSPVTISTESLIPGTPLVVWRMHGGVGSSTVAKASWSQPIFRNNTYYKTGPTGGSAANFGTPLWYRYTFSYGGQPKVGAHPILRLQLYGLSSGSVWLNGHNLGRYPDPTPAPGIYMPTCWLKKGMNTIYIFDINGKVSGRVKIANELPASRTVSLQTAVLAH